MRRMNRSTIHDEQNVGLVEEVMSQMYTRMLSVVQLTTGNQGAAAAEVDLFTAFPVGAAQMATSRPGGPPFYMINGLMYQLSSIGTIPDWALNLQDLSTPHHAKYELGTDQTTNTPLTAAAALAGGAEVGSISAPFQYVLFTALTSGSGWAYAGEPAVSTGAAEIPPCPEDECPVGLLFLNVRDMSTGAGGPTLKYDWTHDLSSHAITDDVHGADGSVQGDAAGSFTVGLPVAFYTKAINSDPADSITTQSH